MTDEVYVPGYKPLETIYVPGENTKQITERVNECEIVRLQLVMQTVTHFSCLVAGTPIWTNKGLVAIEKIKIGDRVLSQNSETGELAYKPVLRTAVRMNADLIKLEMLVDKVTCSTGHAFWVSGKGWVKARDMQPNMHVHGALGTTPLWRSEPAGKGAVYNLIVADFHSYFVGKDLIYSHDITARKPTDLLMPGLATR